jgi:NADPH:quinone reductase-like Zn-dependent oxidoreductase
MSQLTLTAIGDPDESVNLDEHPDLTIGSDDLLVDMEAATVNRTDLLLAAGRYGVRPQLPAALGAEGVGRVREVGADADPSLAGRRVLVLPTYEQGTWSDSVVVPARNVIAVGEAGDAAQLAMLAINPATALLLLRRFVDLRPGDWIGQNLGNSALGQYVIALARHAGVKTLSVVRRESAVEQVRAAGGDVVLVDGDDLGERVEAALGGTRLRLVLDGLGGAAPAPLAHALEFGGTVVSYAAQTASPPAIGIADLIYNEILVRGFWVINWIRTAPREEIERTYAELVELVEQGVLHAAVEATYPLAAYREAFAHALRPQRSGKVLFEFDAAAA